MGLRLTVVADKVQAKEVEGDTTVRLTMSAKPLILVNMIVALPEDP